MINFTFLEGRNGEIVVKYLAAVDSHSNRVSSFAFKRPYGWEEVPLFNARMNEGIDLGCNWNVVMYHIQRWKLCYVARHHLLLQSVASVF